MTCPKHGYLGFEHCPACLEDEIALAHITPPADFAAKTLAARFPVFVSEIVPSDAAILVTDARNFVVVRNLEKPEGKA